jgi:Nucleotidyl transferase AbiEii toxin, Type IV TA system
MLDLYDEFGKLVRALNKHGVEYALCGGMALAVHKLPRMTIDIDLLIKSESWEKVLGIGQELGYAIRGKDLSFANGAVEIRRLSKIDQESGDLLSLDFLLVTPELQSVWETQVEAEWEGGKFFVVSPAGLIAMKQLRSSGQDLDDIKVLKEAFGDG